MSFEDMIKEAGGEIVYKDKEFFAELDDNGNLKGIIEEVPQVDINGNPIRPHVIIGKGQKLLALKGDSKVDIETRLANKSVPDIAIDLSIDRITDVEVITSKERK